MPEETFTIYGPKGTNEATLYATFTAEIGGEIFNFALTKLPEQKYVALTHVESTKRVCEVPMPGSVRTEATCVKYARGALRDLLDRRGEAIVRSVIAGAVRPDAEKPSRKPRAKK